MRGFKGKLPTSLAFKCQNTQSGCWPCRLAAMLFSCASKGGEKLQDLSPQTAASPCTQETTTETRALRQVKMKRWAEAFVWRTCPSERGERSKGCFISLSIKM